MDFRASHRHASPGDLSTDESMDPVGMGGEESTGRLPSGTSQPDVDGSDPATPGGPSPYNGVEPFGDPATSDPEYLDPKKDRDPADSRYAPVPHIDGPDEDKTTLHNARRTSYVAKSDRYGSR